MANLDQYNQEIQRAEDALIQLRNSIGDTLSKSIQSAITDARELGEAFSEGKDITKQLEGELKKLGRRNEELGLAQRVTQQKYNDAVAAGNRALQRKYQTQLNNISAEIILNQKLDYGLRELNKQVQAKSSLLNLANKVGNAFASTLSTQVKSVKEMTTLAGLMTLIVDAAFKADKQTTELAKSLVITKEQARDVRYEFVEYSRSLNDAFITTTKLIEANFKLGEQLGLAKTFSMDLNKEFVNITQKVGISEDAAGGLFKSIIGSDQGARRLLANTVGTIEKVKQETGLRLNNKKILEATGKVSGQLLANLKGSPPAIAEAIAKTQALGTSLEQAAAQGKTLLDFESSIDNELKAELLTGRELNLERARAAALMGDQKTVAEELSAQAVDFNEYSKLNVIQQEALAKALGLSADQLSDQLFKQQYLNKSREEILAIGGEEALQRMEQLSAQDKFNAAVEKLQDLLGNILAGPLGAVIDGFASILSNTVALSAIMGGALALNLAKFVKGLRAANAISKGGAILSIIKGAWESLGGLPVVGPVLAGAAIAGGLAFLMTQSSKAESVEDAFIPASGPVIKTSAGTFQGRPDDNVLVGTNVSPSGGGNVIAAIGQMTSAIKEMANQRANISIGMDGRKVGTGVYGASTKFA